MMRKGILGLFLAVGVVGLGCEANAQFESYKSRPGQGSVQGAYRSPGSGPVGRGSSGNTGVSAYSYGLSENSSYYYGSGSSGGGHGYTYGYRPRRLYQNYYPGYYSLYGNRAIGTMYQY